MTTAPNFEQFQGFSKQQVEAFTAASATFTKGLQEIAAESTDYSKKAFAASSAVMEKLLAARSVEAAVSAFRAELGQLLPASERPAQIDANRQHAGAGELLVEAK